MYDNIVTCHFVSTMASINSTEIEYLNLPKHMRIWVQDSSLDKKNILLTKLWAKRLSRYNMEIRH
jgi:fumarate reductase subunit C